MCEAIRVWDYLSPCCGDEAPEWEGEHDDYKGNNGDTYPKIISHNKKLACGLVLMNFNGEYMSYDWTEIHYCNKCDVEWQFENSSC